MTRRSKNVLFAIVLSSIMLVSMVAPVAGGAIAAGDGSANSIQTGQSGDVFQQSETTINITDELSVWERAVARPAVVDRSGAAVTVDTPTSFVYDNSGNNILVSTEQEAVFDAGDTISFELSQKTGATTTQFNGDQFRVLVVQFDGNRDAVETFLDAQEVNVSEVEDAFEDVDGFDNFTDEVDNQSQVSFSLVREFFEGTEQFEQFAESFATDQEITVDRLFETLTSDEFLDLVSFKTVDGGEISGGDGSATADVTLDEPGSYLLLGHVGGDVYDAGDKRPVFNDTTVIAADAVTAQEASVGLSIQSTDGAVQLGKNISVTANANLAGDNISHATMVFDEDKLADQFVSVNITDDISSDLRTEDVVIRSSIQTLQGVANVQPNTQVSGTTLANERFSGTVNLSEQSTSFFDARNALVDGFDVRDQVGGAAEFTAINNNVLNASVTAVGDQGSTAQVNVETLETWSPGEYTVLHIATDQDTGHVSTARDSITLTSSPPSADDDDDDGGGGGGFGGGGGGDAPSGGTDIVEPPAPPENVDVTFEEGASLEFDEETGQSTVTFSEESNTESISFGFNAAGSATVRNLDTEPAETGPMPGASVSVSEITVSDFLRDSTAVIRMRVSQERLSEIGAVPEDLRINRYTDNGSEWQGLETEVVDENSDRVVLEAETPGFSFFGVSAVGEPQAAIAGPSEITVGEEVTLDGSESSDQYGEVVAYDWTVGDNSFTGETITTSFDEPTDVTVELTVENDAGETSTTTTTITVVEDSTGTDGTDGTGDPGDEPDDSPSPIIAVVLLLFALLVGGGVAYYIIQDEP